MKNKFGHDYILGGEYETAILRAHPDGAPAGFLWEVDGVKSSKSVIEKLAKSGKAPVIRVHGVWKDDHRFGKKEGDLAIERAKELNKIVKKYPSIRWYYSPFLEPRGVAPSFYDEVVKDCKKVLPKGTKFVASSLEGHVIASADYTEMHHDGWKKVSGKTIFSFDGKDCIDADVTKIKKIARSSELFFFWTWAYNGKFGDKDKRERKKRTSWASAKKIQSITEYFSKKGKTELPKGWTYKTHSESYDPPIARSDKPVWLISTKADYIELKAKRKRVYIFFYDGYSTHQKKHLYRGEDWGFEISEKIRKIKKRANVNVFVNGKKKGRIHPSFRDGSYR